MYKRARKLVALMGGAADPLELTKLACEAYVVAINALSMLDPKQAWFAYPISAEPEDRVCVLYLSGIDVILTSCCQHSTKRRKLCRHIPEHRFSAASRDSEIIELATLQQEYALMSARLALLRHDPTLLSVGGKSASHRPSLPPLIRS